MQGVLKPPKTPVSTRNKQSQSGGSTGMIWSKTGALSSSLSYSSSPTITATTSQPVGINIGLTDSFASASNAQPPPTPKQPLRAGAGKKRFAPKTRSGCLTCRARRVKCDEAKPSCTRCVKGQHKCRYALTFANVFMPVKLMTADENGAASDVEGANESATEDVRMLQRVTLRYGSSEECYYLDRFLRLAAPWFSHYLDPTFFYNLVPQRSWSSPALKHTVVAIALAVEEARFGTHGAEHPMFNWGYEKWDRRRHEARHHWHYSQALEHVYRESGIAEDVVLLTSALFWLHDNVTRRSATAMVHLQGFLRLVTERRLRREKDRASWWRERENDWETVILRTLVFSADVADDAFAATIEPDLMKSIRSRMSDSTYSRSFKSMATVQRELRLGLTAIPYSVPQVLEEPDGGLDANGAVSTTELRTYFERWYAAFSTIPNAHPVDRILLECHYICATLRLQIHECGEGLKTADDVQSIHRMEHILSMLETVDFKAIVQPPLGTDVELAVIPILTQLVVLSSNVDIRRRSFNILKNLHRVEGLWSSDVVFDLMSIAYPLSGRDGPWKRDVLKPARLSPLTATDDTVIAIRDGRDIVDEPALRAMNLDHEDGIVRLPYTNGPGKLAKPLSAEEKLADKFKDSVRAKSTSVHGAFLPKQNAAPSKPNTLYY